MVIPNHIAIILDGNRRFARKIALQPWKGHEYGADKVEKLIEWCHELKIKELTLYAFSMQNFQREKNEVEFLIKIFREKLKKILEEKIDEINEKKIRIRFIGRTYLFPIDTVDVMNKLQDITFKNNNLIVNFAMAYGGREELIDTFKKVAKEIKENRLTPENIDENIITKNLYLNSSPEIIIRTSGEKRTSNFLPWQSVYSEWFFIEKFWPEFEKDDLIKIIEDFSKRERRFGK